jgi:hypothetical protein
MLASGLAVPIMSLKVGDKVLATNVKTGKTRAEPVTAVLVHHDTDRYNLKIKADGKTAVIDTTRSHLFWNQDTRRWTKAAALKYGTHLRSPSGTTVTVIGGYIPADSVGWMWDLSVPGNGDHDFYIDVVNTAVLVHNCDVQSMSDSGSAADRNGFTRAGRAFQKHFFRPGSSFTPPTAAEFLGDTQAPDVLNPLGQDALDDILTNPQTAIQRYGDRIDMKLPWGGARFIGGRFDGFLSP